VYTLIFVSGVFLDVLHMIVVLVLQFLFGILGAIVGDEMGQN
jgi:hypothetical protein